MIHKKVFFLNVHVCAYIPKYMKKRGSRNSPINIPRNIIRKVRIDKLTLPIQCIMLKLLIDAPINNFRYNDWIRALYIIQMYYIQIDWIIIEKISFSEECTTTHHRLIHFEYKWVITHECKICFIPKCKISYWFTISSICDLLTFLKTNLKVWKISIFFENLKFHTFSRKKIKILKSRKFRKKSQNMKISKISQNRKIKKIYVQNICNRNFKKYLVWAFLCIIFDILSILDEQINEHS